MRLVVGRTILDSPNLRYGLKMDRKEAVACVNVIIEQLSRGENEVYLIHTTFDGHNLVIKDVLDTPEPMKGE
jgi:hypothetical protein